MSVGQNFIRCNIKVSWYTVGMSLFLVCVWVHIASRIPNAIMKQLRAAMLSQMHICTYRWSGHCFFFRIPMWLLLCECYLVNGLIFSAFPDSYLLLSKIKEAHLNARAGFSRCCLFLNLPQPQTTALPEPCSLHLHSGAQHRLSVAAAG